MHLVIAITPHGFGHAAQVAPVINALRERLPSLRLTLLTSLPEYFLRERIDADFQLIGQAPDFGLVMNSALDIDLEASAGAYAELHHHWQTRVEQEARQLVLLEPDLVLADIPYLTLAAAHHAGIPSVALCSLNWADIYHCYFNEREEAGSVLEQMQVAYRSAMVFLCPEPSMPMKFLDNRQAIGVIARTGTNRRQALVERLGIAADKALVLVAPGGVQTRFAMEDWPQDQGIHWLVSEKWDVRHPDASALEQTGLSFTDLLTSCDAVLGKCGYGTVTECVLNGTPLLYIRRPDWPEEHSLTDWLEKHNAGLAVDPQRLLSGIFAEQVATARDLSLRACDATGAVDAASCLERYLLQQSASCG